jgi:3-hydroxyisobutyrate dehydrogenase-like beta-hydroxyacid dehydrogenase
MHIAFIGTGNMGLPMLANLLKKGFSATAYDIVPAEAAAAGEIVTALRASVPRAIEG